MKRSILSIVLAISSLAIFATDGYKVDYSTASNGNHQLEFTLDRFSVSETTLNGDVFSKIDFEGKIVTNKKGYAELPFLNASVMIGPERNVSIEVVPGEYEEISLAHPLVPSRGVIYRTQDPSDVPYKTDPRSVTDTWYPVNIAENTDPYIIRDIRGTTVYVYPFQYNAARQVLRVYKTVTVVLTENNTVSLNPLLRPTTSIVREMDGIYKSVFINYNATRDNLTIGEFGDIHVIVTARDEEAIQPYVQWKREKGFDVSVEVVPSGTVVNSNVQAAYDANNEILYVLLVGDWADIQCTTSGAGRPMDPQVGTVVGDDDFADIAVGRFSANSPADVTVQVNKVIAYERQPELNGTWYSYATGVASAEGAGIGDDGESDIQHEDVIYDDKLDPFTYTNFTDIYDPGASASEVANAVNAGTTVINYTGHGYGQGWGTTGFSNSDVANLTNGDKLPFIIAVACNNGDFDLGTCFAEAWLRKENGGAIMFLGASISQPWAEPMRGQDYFMDILIGGYDYEEHPGQNGISTTEQRTTLGSIVFNGLTLMCVESDGGSDWETAKTWNYFGDPSVQPRTATPEELTLSNTLIMVGIPFTTIVSSDDGPVANAMVALSQDGLYFSGVTNAEGSVTIEQALNLGNAKLVVTGFNTETIYEDYSVIPPSGPYVTIASVEVDDAEGNADGLLDYTEIVHLNIGLVNVGSADAENVSATLFSIDNWITLLDSEGDFGTIPAGDTVFVSGAFQMAVSNQIPDLHDISIDLSATTDTRDTWVSTFELTGHAPVLVMDGYSIDDATGNNNGRLDPGETVLISLTAMNSGSSDAYTLVGALTSANPNVVVPVSPLEYGDLESGQSGTQAFTAVVSESTPTGEAVQFTFDIIAFGEITGQAEFVEYIGQIPVLLLDWDNNHNSPDAIAQCLTNLEVEFDHVSEFPEDINLYASVFVCLGTYDQNHVLTEAEGTVLAGYLNAGGNLFMEGADTWYYDPQFTPTPLHEMFNITGTEDGGSDLTTLDGQAGTIVEGMSYEFSGDNSYIDHIEPIPPAKMMFMNAAPSFGAGVSYDAGTYRTVGFSFEFGGLQDGERSKDDLMIEMLEFFNIQGVWTNVDDNAPVSVLTNGSYPNPFNGQTSIYFETQDQCRVTIDIYNLNGMLIDRIYDAEVSSGIHKTTWSGIDNAGTPVAAGMYFYMLNAGNDKVSGKLLKTE